MTTLAPQTQLTDATAVARPARVSPLTIMADQYNIEPGTLFTTLKKTVIKPTDKHDPTNEEVAAFVIVANQYGLNPFTREIHAFADPRKGVIPIVGVDGWARIVNGQPLFDGCEFEYTDDDKGKPISCTCTMHVKGRSHPVRVTEYMAECRRDTAPWTQMPRRMLRHKAFMQAARLAFSISGIHDEDEARDVITRTDAAVETPAPPVRERVAAALHKATTERAATEYKPDPRIVVPARPDLVTITTLRPEPVVDVVAKPKEEPAPAATFLVDESAASPSVMDDDAYADFAQDRDDVMDKQPAPKAIDLSAGVAFTGREATAAGKTWDILAAIAYEACREKGISLQGEKLRGTIERWMKSLNPDWSIQSLNMRGVRNAVQDAASEPIDWAKWSN